MTKRKTLLVTLDFPPLTGGVAEYYFQRVKKMDPEKIVVLVPSVIPAQAGIQHYGSWIPGQARNDIKIYHRKFFIFWFWPRWLPLIKHLFSVAKKEKIEAFWVGQVLPVGTAVWLFCKFYNFFKRRDPSTPPPADGSAQDDKKLTFFITCHGNDLLRAKSHPRKFRLAKRILRDAELVEANTAFTKNILMNDFNVPAEKIEIVYPENTLRRAMVDEKKVRELRQKYNLGGKKVLLTVARLVKSKGIDTVINTLSEIWKEVPNLVYLIVGDGPYFPELVRMSSELLRILPPNPPPDFATTKSLRAGLLIKEGSFPVILPFISGGGPMEHRTEGVIFVGNVLHEDLPNYYALADAFILTPHQTGIDTESFGLVYLEAAEFGLPIIAGDVGGAREALANYDKTILVDSENEKEISNKVLEVLKAIK